MMTQNYETAKLTIKIDNEMRQNDTNNDRTHGGGAGTELDRFKRCVAALHRNILQGYDHWCEHVGLPMRIPAVAWSQLAGGRDNPRAPVRGLLDAPAPHRYLSTPAQEGCRMFQP